MIDSRELRIGSLIYFFGKIKTVIRIGKESSGWYIGCADKQTELMNCWNIEDAYDPIPLTEDWLLKFGAKEVKARRGVLKEFVLKTVRLELSNSHNIYYKNSKRILDSVHSLQNLFYTLRGEELCLKP